MRVATSMLNMLNMQNLLNVFNMGVPNSTTQGQTNQNTTLRNNGSGDNLSVSEFAKREALYDKIQGMIDRGESLESLSFETFQSFAMHRYNMPITQQRYDMLLSASKSSEHFDQLLRETLSNWKKNGAGNAGREALYDSIQEMIDRGESLQSISFEQFQSFAIDRHNMPMTKQIYTSLNKASKSREHFDQLLRDVVQNWSKSGAASKLPQSGGNMTYGTYGRDAKVNFR